MVGPPPGQRPGRRPGPQRGPGPEGVGRRNPGLFNIPGGDNDDENDEDEEGEQGEEGDEHDVHSRVSHIKTTLERASTDVEIAGSFKARRQWYCELSWSSRLSRRTDAS